MSTDGSVATSALGSGSRLFVVQLHETDANDRPYVLFVHAEEAPQAVECAAAHWRIDSKRLVQVFRAEDRGTFTVAPRGGFSVVRDLVTEAAR